MNVCIHAWVGVCTDDVFVSMCVHHCKALPMLLRAGSWRCRVCLLSRRIRTSS